MDRFFTYRTYFLYLQTGFKRGITIITLKKTVTIKVFSIFCIFKILNVKNLVPILNGIQEPLFSVFLKNRSKINILFAFLYLSLQIVLQPNLRSINK